MTSPFTRIAYIGHGTWRPDGAPPTGTVELLLWCLERHPLMDWSFIDPARDSHAYRDAHGVTQYEDMGPVYPEHPNTVRCAGNLRTLSLGWLIDTDDPSLIEALTTAYSANRARFAERSPTTYEEALRLHADGVA